MNDQAQAVDDESIAEQMAAYLEAEEANPEMTEQAEEETSQEAEAETETEEGEQEPETVEDEVLEIQWNGEAKTLKKSEVVELAQKGYDYTAKTQQLAEQRKTLEAQADMLKQQAIAQQFLSDKVAEVKALDQQLAQYKQVNWQDLAQNDPMQYLTLNQQFQQLKDAKNEKVGEYQQLAHQLTQAQQAHQQKQIEAEVRLLTEAVPEFKGEKAQQTKAELESYLASRGFSSDDVAKIVDHRILRMAYEAAQYAKIKSAQPAVTKRMAEAPKVVKGKQPAPNNAVRELKDRAKRGDEKAIVALIERGL